MQWILLEFFPEFLLFFAKFKNKFTSTKSLLLYPILFIFLIFFYLNALGVIYYLVALFIFVALVFFVNEKDYGDLNHLPHFVKIDGGMDVCYFKTKLKFIDLHGKVIHIELPQSHLPIEIIFSETAPVKFKFNHQVIKGISLDHVSIIMKRII
uniref:hypothetical protein n=1 Tax=Acinetobacter sp. P8-3-8 TaxID=1029823 RepID=UPI0002485D7F